MTSVIEIKNLSKKYKITHRQKGYVALRDVLGNILKNPFGFTKSKAKQIMGKETREDFWALRNINLTVEKGDIVGIIGKNGAGKSTLLKILTQITPPTTGEARITGRVASLLEVGTGFHPELSGRENIYLNGVILGMTRKEISKKFDQIVEFSGVEKFLDTPVKRYSSGMYVRLAFSVAAHMEPDILLVDEVLAVGDAEFQKKCLGKMDEVTKQAGRTIIFVSHNMQAIEKLCNKCILLQDGQIIKTGNTKEVVDYYLDNQRKLDPSISFPTVNKDAYITKVSFTDERGEALASIPISNSFDINVEYTIANELVRATLGALFYSQGELLLLSFEADKKGALLDYKPGSYKTNIKIPAFLFNVGSYYIDLTIERPGIEMLDKKQNIHFEITNENNPRSAIIGPGFGKMGTILNFETKEI
jgi:lipopolysaccharide transport system ATP-binding protein